LDPMTLGGAAGAWLGVTSRISGSCSERNIVLLTCLFDSMQRVFMHILLGSFHCSLLILFWIFSSVKVLCSTPPLTFLYL
jgi:hypothetical protein